MSFSTRATPRLAQSPVALTSLGAVGGPRGTAAGALRIFVEFLTTYDKSQITALQSDLNNIDHAQATSAKAEVARQTRITAVKNKLAEVERITKGKLNTQLRADLKQIELLETSRSKANRETAATQREVFNRTAASLGVSKSELVLLSERGKLTKEQTRELRRQEVAEQGQTQRARQRLQIENQIGKVQAGRAALGPKLAGLAIGAIGGVVGGTILGVGFQLAQAGLEKLGEILQDIVDPARHAREALDSLGASVVELARAKDLTILEAATQKADELGKAGDKATIALLQEAAAQKLTNDAVREYIDLITAAAHPDANRTKDIEDLTKALIEEAKQAGKNVRDVVNPEGSHRANLTLIDGVNALILGEQRYNEIHAAGIRLSDEAVLAKQREAQATAFLRIQQEALNNALNASAALQLKAIDKQIAGLDTGPSSGTKSIQAALDAAQHGSNLSSQLKQIGDERELILLRQRLRLLGANINLERFSGKFLLEAINAKIAALQKEGDEQDRLNRLLDLQYQMSQAIKRQSGESVGDFLGRRAQEQRHQLIEEANIIRDNQVAALEDRRQQVEDEVALAELAAQRIDAIRSEAKDNYIRGLQEQLDASQKADQDALQAKKDALDAEKQAITDKVNEAIRLSNQQSIEETNAAIAGADNIEKLNQLAGRLAGLSRAKATIEALVESFGIPAGLAKPFLDNINAALAAYRAAKSDAIPGAGASRFKNKSFASGGIIDLKNSRNPFGQNIRTGEEGSEIGVILSNRVARAIKDSSGANLNIESMTINRSPDPYRDRHMFKRAVREAVQEVIGG